MFDTAALEVTIEDVTHKLVQAKRALPKAFEAIEKGRKLLRSADAKERRRGQVMQHNAFNAADEAVAHASLALRELEGVIGEPQVIRDAYYTATHTLRYCRPHDEDSLSQAMAAVDAFEKAFRSTPMADRIAASEQFAQGLEDLLVEHLKELQRHAIPCNLCGEITAPYRLKVRWMPGTPQLGERDAYYACKKDGCGGFWIKQNVGGKEKRDAVGEDRQD
jgi:hypothetical protein